VPRRVIRNLDEFYVGLTGWAEETRGRQRLIKAQSKDRVQSALDNAARRLAGSDRVISRVGAAAGRGRRSGARIGAQIVGDTPDSVMFKAIGAWQIRDNSISGGRTAPHTIGPRNDRNPRPLPPAKSISPSLEFRSGGFSKKAVAHDGSSRIPAWRNAVQSVQPRIIEAHERDFRDTLARNYR
jgi:hypothetical protein